MKKAVGYGIAILGLVVMTANIALPEKITFLSLFGPNSTIFIAIGLVALGVVIAMLDKNSSSGKIKHSAEEVPIYEGTGKNRKIVGYRREEK